MVRLSSYRRALPLLAAAFLSQAGCQTQQVHPSGITAAQAAGLQAGGFEHTDRGWEFMIPEPLLFASDEGKLQPDQRPVVDHVAQLLAQLDIPGVTVEGHADSTGTKAHNLTLSRHRAEAVAEEMRAAGFPTDRISVVGLGEEYPVESNHTSAGRRENRRVVILVSAR